MATKGSSPAPEEETASVLENRAARTSCPLCTGAEGRLGGKDPPPPTVTTGARRRRKHVQPGRRARFLSSAEREVCAGKFVPSPSLTLSPSSANKKGCTG